MGKIARKRKILPDPATSTHMVPKLEVSLSQLEPGEGSSASPGSALKFMLTLNARAKSRGAHLHLEGLVDIVCRRNALPD